MSLHGDLRVNGYLIGVWDARRVTPDQPSADTVSTYVWEYAPVNESLTAVPLPYASGTVEHRYGDGAPALAAKVLSAVGAALPTQIQKETP